MSLRPLDGKAILIVEDEYVIATDLCQELTKIGARIIGPVPSVRQGIDMIAAQTRIDAAILDVNLQGEMAFSLAELLRDRAVPFLFMTGYEHSAIPPQFAEIVRCEKPLVIQTVSRALASIIKEAW